MFEQRLFDFKEVDSHNNKTHPYCHFCHHRNFYDQDALNRHYITDHHFCDLCKKLGRKKVVSSKSKLINLPEYEVYRDWLELRKHQQREHFVCNKTFEACRILVFESSAQLSSHYMNAHGQQMPVQLEFGDSDEE